MKLCVISVCLIIIIIFTTAPIPSNSIKAQSDIVRLLRLGTYPGGYSSVKTGEVWYGLFPSWDNERYELMLTRIMIVPGRDIHRDRKDEQTGERIILDHPMDYAENSNIPLILINGLDVLEEGSVNTIFPHKERIRPNDMIELILDETHHYEIIATAVKTKSGHFDRYRNFTIILHWKEKDVFQLLASYDGLDEDKPPILHWAGDLDKDGELDLIMDLANHYAYSKFVLFLSSFSKGFGCVGKAGEFVIPGC